MKMISITKKSSHLFFSITLSLLLMTLFTLTVKTSNDTSQNPSSSPPLHPGRTITGTGTITFTANYTVFLPLITQVAISSPLEYGLQVDPNNYTTNRAYEMSREWGWVGPMFLWNLDYALTAPNTALANFGILTAEGPTPAYKALKNMPK